MPVAVQAASGACATPALCRAGGVTVGQGHATDDVFYLPLRHGFAVPPPPGGGGIIHTLRASAFFSRACAAALIWQTRAAPTPMT